MPVCASCISSSDALQKNQELEFERNRERFQFLKWGAKAFDNMLIVPPGSGIVHQVMDKVEVASVIISLGAAHVHKLLSYPELKHDF